MYFYMNITLKQWTWRSRLSQASGRAEGCVDKSAHRGTKKVLSLSFHNQCVIYANTGLEGRQLGNRQRVYFHILPLNFLHHPLFVLMSERLCYLKAAQCFREFISIFFLLQSIAPCYSFLNLQTFSFCLILLPSLSFPWDVVGTDAHCCWLTWGY